MRIRLASAAAPALISISRFARFDRDGTMVISAMARARIRETELYDPVKRLLEAQGYAVKGEVGAADLVAVRGDEDPVVVELKTGFSLALFHQAVDRQGMTDAVYIAVPLAEGSGFRKALGANRTLCRRLGLGLMTVRPKDGFVELHLDPAPYRPRQSKARRARLLREFRRRVGDPNTGGATRMTVMTAYRQDAIRCALHLKASGEAKAADVAKATGVSRARQIMYDDHYGWFERVATGVYTLSPKGVSAMAAQTDAVLEPAGD